MVENINDTAATVELRYVSTKSPEEQAVPSWRLIESICGIEKFLKLILTIYDGEADRDDSSRRTKTSVKILAGTPAPFSFSFPLTIIPSKEGSISPSSVLQITSRFWKILSAIRDGNVEEINELIPRETDQKQILRAIKSIFNSFDQDFQLELKDSLHKKLISSVKIKKPYERICNRLVSEIAIFPVFLGEVSKINFKNMMVSLTVPKTNQLVTLPYRDEQEQILIESGRKLIEVHGAVHKDNTNNITKVEKPTNFIPVNLTDMNIADLLPPFLKPKSINNSNVTIELSETKSVYYGTYEDLEIYAGGHSRASIESEITSEISVLWKDIVHEQYTRLSPYAQSLKDKLQGLFKENLGGVSKT